MAAVRLIRPQRKTADWIWVYGMATLAVEAILAGLVSLAHSRDAVFPFQLYRTLSVSLVPGIWLLFSFTFARGDAFEYLKSRPLRSLALVAALPIFAAVFRYHLIGGFRFSDPDSPLLLDIGWAGVIVYAALLVSSILIVMNLERTFRAAVGTIRWRIKFMLMGVGAIFIVRIYTSSQVLLFRGVDLKLELLNSVALIVAAALVARSFLRTRQFEVAVYPSQSVLQGSITVLLAGIYLVVVGILAKMAAYVGGDNEFALKAFVTLVSLVVFAIFLQSDRVRMHLRRFVSRNFQRPLYDYRTVWRKFTEGTASRVQKDELCRSLLKMLADIFQSLSVAIWLWDDNREGMELTASTFVSGEKMAESKISAATAATLKKLFESAPDALDLEEHRSEWAGELKDRHPSQFPNGGHRICVPLVTQGEVIGLITLGDRVGGVEFSLQDFDMLKCVADDAAARLRNAQLSQKLLQAKELEAFQTMAAFFVHDLKNAASTLNLMLQNLPDHFDDPAFREDALRGVSKSVDHINRLIGRLGMLRHESTLHPTPQDLNDVVTAGMESLEQAAGGALSKDLRPLPKVMLDREQFGKVVTNLVLNATEALGRGGNIRVETRREGHWAVLSVADNGAGMSPEFLAKGLFRPFQTTKKTGLGIGMFQSKMIVEGHGGRITVASELGKGTTFEVFLPLAPQKP
ncbi:MAG TPA: XrtA/PEP-CTERM system histidine kinase PrsK [Opitutaceae bacterium]|nr:XrtA/PEP-CTERM system histidine kinase PrsK [Opitutaceae bacterium]